MKANLPDKEENTYKERQPENQWLYQAQHTAQSTTTAQRRQ